MKDSLFRIGEMAAMNHVSTQTLRLYAKIKLLEPEYLDPETGYRYYTLEQCAKLDLIRALKSCCLPLERIREILELSSEQLLLQALEEQTAALRDEIYRLSVSRSGLLRIQRNLQVLSSLPPLGQVFFEYDTSLEPEYARKLYQEIVRQDMVPCGDYICEVLSKFPMDHSGQITYKIQVPVQRARQTSRR